MARAPENETRAHVGDHVSVESHRRGVARRVGEILEVLGAPGDEYYRVEWGDGHVSLYHPGSDTVVVEAVERERAQRAAEPERAEPEPSKPPAPAVATAEPAQPPPSLQAVVGDRLVIRHHHLGEHDRDAEILEVLGQDGQPPYRVRWSDTGREAIVRPGTDAYVDHLTAR